MEIGTADLLAKLRKLDRTQFVSFIAVTVPTMKQRGNPLFGRVRKITQANGAVLTQRERSRGRSWGKHAAGCPVLEHTGRDGVCRCYLDIRIVKRVDVYFDTETKRQISRDVVRRWIRNQAAPSQLRKQFLTRRDFAVESIAEIRLASQVFAVYPLWVELRKFIPERVVAC